MISVTCDKKKYGAPTMKCIVVYISCFGEQEQTKDLLSRNNALSIVEYLKKHPIAKPLYLINVKMKLK